MARPNRRSDLERAAIQLFAQKGSGASTIRDISHAAGMTEASIYRHFSSKQDLIVTLFREGMEKLGGHIAHILESDDPPQKRIEETVRLVLDSYEQDSDLITFLLFDLHAYPDEEMYKEGSNPSDLVAAFVQEVCPNQDVPLLTGMVMGMITQPIILHRYGRLTLHPETAAHISTKVQQVLGL